MELYKEGIRILASYDCNGTLLEAIDKETGKHSGTIVLTSDPDLARILSAFWDTLLGASETETPN